MANFQLEVVRDLLWLAIGVKIDTVDTVEATAHFAAVATRTQLIDAKYFPGGLPSDFLNMVMKAVTDS